MACSASTALGGARKKNGYPRMRAVVVPRPDMQHSRFTTSTSHAAQASRRPGDQTSGAGVRASASATLRPSITSPSKQIVGGAGTEPGSDSALADVGHARLACLHQVARVDKDRVLVVAPRAQYAVVTQQALVHKLEGIEHRPERRDGSDLEFAEPLGHLLLGHQPHSSRSQLVLHLVQVKPV